MHRSFVNTEKISVRRNIQKSAAGFLVTSAALFVVSNSAAAQTYQGAISTAGYGQNQGYPFGLNFAPNGDLYVCLAGTSTFGDPNFANNNVVVRINPTTNQIVSQITVGLFPEEIAFASPSGGATVGIVTNSTDGTVSIFDLATEQILNTVTLPNPFFGSYPFGIVTNANDTVAYISTGDGANTLRAIDLDPNSANVYQYISGSDLPITSGNGSRMARVGNDLYIPTTAYQFDFSGSTAFIERLPLPGSGNANAFVGLKTDNTFFKYPSGQDVAIAPNGICYVSGYDFTKRIYGFDTATGALVRSFPVGTTGQGHTGLAISPDGKVLVVCDVTSDEIAFVDIARGTTISVINTVSLGFGYFGPNDAVFSPDGTKVYVTTQFSEAVLRFSAPASPSAFTPPLGFTISPTNPAIGGNVTLTTVGAVPGEFVAIVADDFDVSVDFGTFGILHFTENAAVVATAFDVDISIQVQAPNIPTLYCKNFLCQALTYDPNTGYIRLSDEIPVILQ